MSAHPAPAPAGVPAAYRRLHADATRVLTDWHAPDAEQERRRVHFLDILAHHPGAVWREGPARHLTASALVLDEAGEHVLLTLHRKAHLWLQFGGHLEPEDEDLHAASTREAREESGLPGLRLAPGVVDLHAHELSGSFGRCHEHLDVRFAGTARRDGRHAVSDESDDVRWWPLRALPAQAAPDLVPLARAAIRHLSLG
ncbi:MAG TPA: NUDIX domain-containing protein [Segeticoccus sp.]|nr:NUDIX domain-containing protein [Segeticoccus sp.]